ncbi:MAG: class I SAM-dependent methyltransferase [Candidatus Methanomethyliaceae archaeon]|nr:class I SAM-dependent methyltransferase [Candidatus Methanomethyliaceae archaeon]
MSMPEEIPWPFSRLYDRYVNRVFVKWFKQIAKEINDKQISGTILDIGTGPGRLPIEIAKQAINVRVYGIDISEDAVRIAKRNAEKEGLANRVNFKVGSAYNTGFENCSVDLVVSTGVMHHLKDPLKAFNEIYRILKYGKEAWIYDGRKDATRIEIEETIQRLDMMEDLPLPLWIVERIWSYMHVGYKTDEYISGKIGRALERSLFKTYTVQKEGAYIRIVLKKT